VAGDATGIILAAVITARLGLPMWIDLIVEYVAGFAFGLFIFQSLFMKSMMGGTYWANVRKTFLPEFISMNFMIQHGASHELSHDGTRHAGDGADRAALLGCHVARSDRRFCKCLSLECLAVARRLKHGLMTERTRGSRFDLEKRHGASAQTDGTHSEHADHVPHLGGGEHATGSHHVMESDATPAQRTALAAVSFLMLVAGMVAPANWVNLRLSARDVGGAIMPPGMIMDRNTPAEAMLDMAAVDPRDVVARLGLEARGRS
jgi:hypothetical protein